MIVGVGEQNFDISGKVLMFHIACYAYLPN